jgi:hypothetical protein
MNWMLMMVSKIGWSAAAGDKQSVQQVEGKHGLWMAALEDLAVALEDLEVEVEGLVVALMVPAAGRQLLAGQVEILREEVLMVLERTGECAQGVVLEQSPK